MFYGQRLLDINDGKPKWTGISGESDLGWDTKKEDIEKHEMRKKEQAEREKRQNEEDEHRDKKKKPNLKEGSTST